MSAERTADSAGVVADGDLPHPEPGSSASFAGARQLPVTGRQVAQFIASRAAACVGADFSNLALLSPRGDALRVFHDTALESEIADRYTEFGLDAPYPLTDAARGQVVLLPDLDAYREHYADLVPDTIAAGFQSTASLPLHRADGTVLGAIGFAWTEPTPFDAKLEGALRGIASLCTETVERAERYEAEHELIVELQERLLGDIPSLAGIGTAARYLSATRASSIGGDWYEGLLVGDSQLAVVVGDITGHGVAAAADMALIRGMTSALLHAHVPLADVFGMVSGVLDQRTDVVLATEAVAIIDVSAETIMFATAGHPPPLLLLPNGAVRLLDFANGPMIGIPTTQALAATVPFPPDAQLVMFTDGLVERRDRPFTVGIEQAARHLAALPHRLSAQHLIDSLLQELVGDAKAEDDIAIVVIENTT